MSVKPKRSARSRILAAADELAREIGPAHVSLDAVAVRAGVSKGGLLYHFPSKLALLTALVEDHIDRFVSGMEEQARRSSDRHDALLEAYLRLSAHELCHGGLPKSGVLAAIVEFPELLSSIAGFKRRLFERLMSEARDEKKALLVFLAIEGLRSMQLMDMQILTEKELERAIAALEAVADSRD